MAYLDSILGESDPSTEEFITSDQFQGGYDWGEEGGYFGGGSSYQADLCANAGQCYHPIFGCIECPEPGGGGYEDSCPGVNCPAGTELNEETCICEQVEEYDPSEEEEGTMCEEGEIYDPTTGQCVDDTNYEDPQVEEEKKYKERSPYWRPDYSTMKDYLLSTYGIQKQEESEGGYLKGLLNA